jgi:hypothetical protein
MVDFELPEFMVSINISNEKELLKAQAIAASVESATP